MVSRRSRSIATQPMPPSLKAILILGKAGRYARPDPFGTGSERKLTEEAGQEAGGLRLRRKIGRQSRRTDME